MKSQCWDPLRRRCFSSSFFSFNDADALCLQKNDFCSSELLPNYRGAVTDGRRKKANICPVCGKRKRKSASQRQMFAFFLQHRPDSRFGHNYWGKKRASANQSLFFKLSRVSNCWSEEKKQISASPNLRRMAKKIY